MAKDREEKSLYATRQAIGSLFRAVTLSTDPANTLSFSSSLITTTRGALIQKLEDRVPDSEMLPGIFNGILRAIVQGAGLEQEEIQTIDQRIDAVFKSESMARYGLEIFRDALFTENLHKLWKEANALYIRGPAGWSVSNSGLSDIHFVLNEIIIRHNLMQFPRGEVFNIDEQDTTAMAIAKAMDKIQRGNEQ